MNLHLHLSNSNYNPMIVYVPIPYSWIKKLAIISQQQKHQRTNRVPNSCDTQFLISLDWRDCDQLDCLKSLFQTFVVLIIKIHIKI